MKLSPEGRRHAANRTVNTNRPSRIRHLDRDTAAAWLNTLEEARAQAAGLKQRLRAAGQFKLFGMLEGPAGQFRFSWEADGRPANQCAWTDLG